MKTLFAPVLVAAVLLAGVATAQDAQDGAWVQIEAHPDLDVAEERARDYAARLADVAGFALGGKWYGILLGPYAPDDAERVLRVYRAERQIPRDSFLTDRSALGSQFWPVGADVLSHGSVAAPPLPGDAARAAPVAPDVPTQAADETPDEARRSEQLLSLEARQDLQRALQAEGLYDATIDGAFGQGTRASMAAWQRRNGFEETGILTTAQRAALIEAYNAPLTSVGMDRLRDEKTGIEMRIPAAVVRFSRYEAPFAHFEPAGDLGVRVLLISQPGDQATLAGLYDIMQTLEIVPLDGPRTRSADSFTLEGRGPGIVSYTEARLQDGQIKGFTLVWPEGDEARRTRVLDEMIASFTRIDGVLDPVAGTGDAQSIDLVSGLQIRKPRLYRSGFFVDRAGAVVTSADAARGCTRITLDDDIEARLVVSDETLGVAVLAPNEPLAPIAIARFRADPPRLQSDVAVAGYSYGGVLNAPTLTFGTLAALSGLGGEANLARLSLEALPGDAGGPVFDAGGSVLGMLLAPESGTRRLPEDVSFAAEGAAIRALLEKAGVTAENGAEAAALDPEDLSRAALGMTVLVSCWD